MKKILKSKGFTLIEVLLVVVIISILAAIVIVAVNPAEQIESANDAKRANDIRVIMDAVSQYAIDHDGDYPSEIGSIEYIADDEADLHGDLVPTYIGELPLDPEEGEFEADDDYNTGYQIEKDGDRIKITAPNHDDDLSITR